MRLPLRIPLERRGFSARLLTRGEVMALTLRADGRLDIERADGSCVEVDIDASTTVFASLIVLRYRVVGRIASLVLPHAATGPEAHRRLRVWLRCRARGAARTGISAAA